MEDCGIMKSPLRTKSYAFALSTVHLCQDLIRQHREHVLAKQLLKSATSVGANIEEAQFAQSRDDFISKLSISLKEANESRYWLRLLRDAQLVSSASVNKQITDLDEVLALLVSSIKTAKRKSS